MCMVRNSCGSNAYVSDEIITSRAGVRLRVVNTDAEGRMAMVDVLAHMKEKALNEVKKSFITHFDAQKNQRNLFFIKPFHVLGIILSDVILGRKFVMIIGKQTSYWSITGLPAKKVNNNEFSSQNNV